MDTQKTFDTFMHEARQIKTRCENTSRTSCEKGKCFFSAPSGNCVFSEMGMNCPYKWDTSREKAKHRSKSEFI